MCRGVSQVYFHVVFFLAVLIDGYLGPDNGNVGGYTEVGCLRYVFEPCDSTRMTCDN